MNEQKRRSKQSKSSPFYVANLAKQLFHTKNISALIYLFLNFALIFGLFWWMDSSIFTGLIAAVVIYGVSAIIALSPLGEFFLRISQDCRKFDPSRKKDVKLLNRLEPLFFEVIERAKRKNPELAIDDDINLYIKDDPDPNAFAIGRRTVCVTTGLLSYSDDQIKGILGHEIGHLATHDTELILLITVGNLFVSAVVTVIKVLIFICELLFNLIFAFVGGSEGTLGRIFSTMAGFMSLIFVNLVMYLWTKLGVLLVMHSSRNAEYEADKFSCNLGYTEGLLSFFEDLMDYEDYAKADSDKSFIDKLKEKTEVFAVLSSSHPATKKRIERIYQAMGK